MNLSQYLFSKSMVTRPSRSLSRWIQGECHSCVPANKVSRWPEPFFTCILHSRSFLTTHRIYKEKYTNWRTSRLTHDFPETYMKLTMYALRNIEFCAFHGISTHAPLFAYLIFLRQFRRLVSIITKPSC